MTVSAAPLIHNLALLPRTAQRQALPMFQRAVQSFGVDLPLYQRLSSEIARFDQHPLSARLSPEVVTHLFEWGDYFEKIFQEPGADLRTTVESLRRLSQAATADVKHPLFAEYSETAKVVAYLGRGVSGDFQISCGDVVSTRREADRLVRERCAAGDECRWTMIPAGRDVRYWIHGRPGGGEMGSKIHHLFDPEVQPDLTWPEAFVLDGHIVSGCDLTMLSEGLCHYFGFPISAEDFLRAFQVDVPGYRMGQLKIFRGEARFRIEGSLETTRGEPAGLFERFIGRTPPIGGVWVANSGGYNANGRYSQHTAKGISRGLHQRFMGFLYRLGVDRMNLSASLSGHYVWPHLGFRHRTLEGLQRLKEIFREYLESLEFWDSDVGARWNDVREAWDIADFTIGGVPIGKKFLLSLQKRVGQDLYFPVGELGDESWARLFRRPSVQTFAEAISRRPEESRAGS